MPIQGLPQLVARLRAVSRAPEAVGSAWGGGAIAAAAAATPVRTGATRRSYRLHPGANRAQITGSKVALFLDAGVAGHTETPRRGGRLVFREGDRTVFARRVNHPGYGARPFLHKAVVQGWASARPADTIVQLWNGAA